MTTIDDFDAELAEMERCGRIKTAYHEAGHAVAAHRLGYRLIRVSIREEPTGHDEPRGVVRGHVSYGDTPIHYKEPYKNAIDHARIAMSGMLGVAIHEGVRHENFHWVEFGATATAGKDDLEDVKQYLREAEGHSNGRKIPRNLRTRTRAVLATKRNRAALEALAQALLQRETLEGPEAIAIIEQARRRAS